MKDHLRGFFAVTKSFSTQSIYRVAVKDNRPVLDKIALVGESKALVGRVEQEADFLAITEHFGLVLCRWESEPPPVPREWRLEDMTAARAVFETSAIAGLFLTEEGARACFRISDLGPWDLRWVKETNDVIAAIGEDHPVFMPPMIADPIARYQAVKAHTP